MPQTVSTLERQMAPQRAYLVSNNTVPEAAHAASEFTDDEPATPAGWLFRAAGRLLLAVAIVGVIAFLFIVSPLIQHRQ